ncbi:MAG: hypothetical protein AAB522_01405 [Patescibacteria group bacterium]
MLYLVFGQNSFEATKKIIEIKKAFLKKNPSFLIEEIDGDDFNAPYDFEKLAKNLNLFSQTHLFIFKNTLSRIKNSKDFANHADFLKSSKDVFLFWEQDLKNNDEIFKIFKKNSAKIQETKIKNNSPSISADNSVFRFVDKLFYSTVSQAYLMVDSATGTIATQSLVNVIFWKLKKISPKNKQTLNLAYKAILTDLNLKMDKKNEQEHLSRLATLVALRGQI